MNQSMLLELMGVDVRGAYCNARAQWTQVERRILSHPVEVSIPHYPSNDIHSFSPLYIGLRNEIRPVPISVLNRLLVVNPKALTDEILHVAIRNPHTTSAIVLRLLELKPQFPMNKYGFWNTPLHAFAKSARSVEAFRILIESNTSALMIRDSHGRIPLFDACSEGSFLIVKLLLEKGKEAGLCGGGLFILDNNGMTALHCVISRIGVLEDTGGHDNCSRHYYLRGTDFKTKCFNAWKTLVICIMYGSDRDSSDCDWRDYTSIVLLATIEMAGSRNKESTPMPMPAEVDWNQVFYLLLDDRYCDSKLLASTPDHSGRLPFHIALENKLGFRDGLLHILNAFPEAIFKDLSDTLLPQMMEVLGKKSGLKMMFSLLSNAPSVLKNTDPIRHVVKRTCLKRFDGEHETNDGHDQSSKKKQRAGSEELWIF